MFYIKNKNRLKVVDYKPEINSAKKGEKKENNIILRGVNLNNKTKNYNFNMPKNKENINNNIIEGQ